MKTLRKTKLKSAMLKILRLFDDLELTDEEGVIVSSVIHKLAVNQCGKDFVFIKSDEE